MRKGKHKIKKYIPGVTLSPAEFLIKPGGSQCPVFSVCCYLYLGHISF